MVENKKKSWGSARALHGAGFLCVFIAAFAWSLCLVAVDIQLQLSQHANTGDIFFK